MKFIKNRIESDPMTAVGGLYSAYQEIRCVIKNKLGDSEPKVGFEIQLIPISKGLEKRKAYDKKSFFVHGGEFIKLDHFIWELIKFRWLFAIRNKIVDSEFIDESINYYVKKCRESVLEGIKDNLKVDNYYGKNEKRRGINFERKICFASKGI